MSEKQLPVEAVKARKTEIKTTRRAGEVRKARTDAAPPRYMVWTPAEGLDPSQRRVAAKAAGLSPEKVDELAEKGLPVPLYGASSEGEAQAWSQQVELPSRIAETDPGLPIFSVAGTALLAVVAVVFTALLPPLGLLLLLGTLLMGFFRVARPVLATRARLQAWQLSSGTLPSSAVRTSTLLSDIRALRSELLRADLAELIRVDLDGQLQDMVWELEELEDAEDRIRRALKASPEDSEMKRRLGELEGRCGELEEQLRGHRSTMAVQP